ncbi:MAG: CopG family transcriptional regulator [Actinomycetota bacterium]
MKAPAEKQNITLALPKPLLRRVKIAAAERDTSISAILTGLLEDFLRRSADDYEQAMRNAITAMRKGYDLGTRGRRTWTRDELHAR